MAAPICIWKNKVFGKDEELGIYLPFIIQLSVPYNICRTAQICYRKYIQSTSNSTNVYNTAESTEVRHTGLSQKRGKKRHKGKCGGAGGHKKKIREQMIKKS